MERLKEAFLLSRIRSGDQAAFVETYELFAPKIYRHALFKTSSPEAAEDVLSETFLKAWEYVREHAGEVRHLRAFLYRIADNLIIDFYRKRAKSAVPLTEEMEETLPVDARIAESADRALAGEAMAAMLKRLRSETRELLVMRYIDDLSIGEIAELTGKKKNAVYVALHRAVKELKHLCAEPSSDN